MFISQTRKPAILLLRRLKLFAKHSHRVALTIVLLSLFCRMSLAQTNPVLLYRVLFTVPDEPAVLSNEATNQLEKAALFLQSNHDGVIAIVGYADGESGPLLGKKVDSKYLAALRAVNSKAYLREFENVDPSKFGVYAGTGHSQAAYVYFVPAGSSVLDISKDASPVDELSVKCKGPLSDTNGGLWTPGFHCEAQEALNKTRD